MAKNKNRKQGGQQDRSSQAERCTDGAAVLDGGSHADVAGPGQPQDIARKHQKRYGHRLRPCVRAVEAQAHAEGRTPETDAPRVHHLILSADPVSPRGRTAQQHLQVAEQRRIRLHPVPVEPQHQVVFAGPRADAHLALALVVAEDLAEAAHHRRGDLGAVVRITGALVPAFDRSGT